MQKMLFILLFYSLVIGVSAETISLTNGESINGKIIGFNDQKIYLGSGKTLFIISLSMISEIVDDRNISINIDDIPDLYPGKPNYNAFNEFKQIKPEKPPKLFTPQYKSKKYEKYYDHRVNRMFYGSTARTLEKNVFSLSNYDLVLNNYCFGISNHADIEIFTAPFIMLSEAGLAIKYRFYKNNYLNISIRSSIRHLSDPIYDEGYRYRRITTPQSVIFTFGDIDKYISGYLGIDPTIEYLYDGTNKYVPVIYHLGTSFRLFKHINMYMEIFNSCPLPDDNYYRGDYDITLASGFRFFWSKNSFDIGILYYPCSESQTDNNFTPIISYTHHFYKK